MQVKPGIKFIFFALLAVILIEGSLQLIGLAFKSSSRLPNKISVNKQKEKRVLCVGDSFTKGVGAPPGRGYPEQLETILNQKSREKFRVFNLGVSGYNSSEILRVLNQHIELLDPQVVVFCGGINDCWSPRHAAEAGDRVSERLRDLLSRLKLFRFGLIVKERLRTVLRPLPKGGGDEGEDKEPEEALALARRLKCDRRYKESLDILLGRLEYDPKNPLVQAEIEDTLIRQNRVVLSLKTYKQIRDRFPRLDFGWKGVSETQRRIAGFFWKNEDYNRAREYYLKARKSDPASLPDQQARLVHSPDRFLLRNLKKMAEKCQEQKALLVLTSYPTQISPSLVEFARKHDLSLVDLRPVFKEELKTSPYLSLFVSETDLHCTQQGYRIMAENIAAKIVSTLSIPGLPGQQ